MYKIPKNTILVTVQLENDAPVIRKAMDVVVYPCAQYDGTIISLKHAPQSTGGRITYSYIRQPYKSVFFETLKEEQ